MCLDRRWLSSSAVCLCARRLPQTGKTNLSEGFILGYSVVANGSVVGHRDRAFAEFVGCEMTGGENNA